MAKNKLKVGDLIYSEYFGGMLEITKIVNDNNWWFLWQGDVLKAQTKLSYFEGAKK